MFLCLFISFHIVTYESLSTLGLLEFKTLVGLQGRVMSDSEWPSILSSKTGSDPDGQGSHLQSKWQLEKLQSNEGTMHNLSLKLWWAFRDSNPGPTGYEPVALTN